MTQMTLALPTNDELIIGLVSISDRASGGVYEDKGLPALKEWFAAALSSPWRAETRLIPDDQATIEKALVELCDNAGGTVRDLSLQNKKQLECSVILKSLATEHPNNLITIY